MRIAKPIILCAALAAGAVSPLQAATQTYSVTLTIGDVSSEGAAPGTNNSSGPQVSRFLCLAGFNNGGTPGPCFSGNFDGSGDKTWTAQGANVLALTPSTTTIFGQRNLNEGNEGTTGNNGTSFYNAYDELENGKQDYSAFGQLNCTTAVVTTPYSCGQIISGLKIYPTVAQNIGPAPTASGNVIVDDVAGTLTGTLTFNQGAASPAGVAYDYRFADASPFNAGRDRASTSATLALNLTGTFTSSSWTITGGEAPFTDPAFKCDKGDLAGTLCVTSSVLGGHQPDGSHLSWKNTPVYDIPDTTGGTVQFILPGVVGTGTVDVAGNVTLNGENHRPSGNSGGGCQLGVAYSATPVLLGPPGGQYLGNLTCGTIGVGIFTLTGSPAVNATPVANPDSATTVVNVPVNVSVLANDTALTDTPLTVTITAQGSKGVATVTGSPGNAGAISVTYTPNLGALGADSFTYQVADKDNDISSATVSVTINDQPVAVNDSANSFGTNPVPISVLANDTGLSGVPLTVAVTTAPAHGTAVVTGSPGAAGAISVTYTSTDNAATPDSFQYRVTDANGRFSTATVALTRAVDITPVAVDDSANTTAGVAVTVDVLANDTAGNAPNTVAIETAPTAAQGTATVNASNQVVFTPAAAFSGAANFSYRLTDNDGQFATAQVTVNVAAPAPVAVVDYAITDEDMPTAAIDVLANDKLGVGTAAEHVITISKPANVGTCAVNPDDTITYTPPPGFFGTDTCTYRLIDLIGQSSTAVVTVTVAKVVTSGSSLDPASLLALGALGVPVALRRRRRDSRA